MTGRKYEGKVEVALFKDVRSMKHKAEQSTEKAFGFSKAAGVTTTFV